MGAKILILVYRIMKMTLRFVMKMMTAIMNMTLKKRLKNFL